jgi:hypothetical protein
MKNLFTSHPREVNETYIEHMRYALIFSSKLLFASVCSFIHAFLPFLFPKTSSSIVHFYHDYLTKRAMQGNPKGNQYRHKTESH